MYRAAAWYVNLCHIYVKLETYRRTDCVLGVTLRVNICAAWDRIWAATAVLWYVCSQRRWEAYSVCGRSGDVIYLLNCIWVVTSWQQYSTHLHTNNTQNDTKQTIYRKTQEFLEQCGPCLIFASSRVTKLYKPISIKLIDVCFIAFNWLTCVYTIPVQAVRGIPSICQTACPFQSKPLAVISAFRREVDERRSLPAVFFHGGNMGRATS